MTFQCHYMTLAINIKDGYDDLSNKAHHKCLPKQISDTILVIEFIEGSCFQQSEVEHFSYKVRWSTSVIK